MARSRHAEVFDTIIVGGGMAGSIVAARLAEAGDRSICVIEAGPPDRHPWIHIPAGYIKLVTNPAYTFPFKTEPGPGIAGRQIATVQGRVLGGSSSINGFNYNRGQRADYDTWAQRGNRGWSYADVLPYFKRSERKLGPGDDRFHGRSGPLTINEGRWTHPLCDAFMDGAERIGIPRNPDYNGATQAGTGYYQHWMHRGLRVSAAKAFLHPATARGGVTVMTGQQVSRILFEGRRAVGVVCQRDRASPPREIRARREVVLSAGTANTAKLLQISGVGPGALLQSLGVPVVHELAGVGEGLQDHYSVRLVARVKGITTINELVRFPRLLGQIARWTLGMPSVLATSPSVAYGFCASREGLDEPDLQLLVTPGSYQGSVPGLLDAYPGMTVGFYQQRPLSRGWVRARSPDPFEHPAIQPNYLTDAYDQRVVIDGIRLVRRIMATPDLMRFTESEISPGPAVQSDDELIDFARRGGSTGYHLVSAGHMGPDNDTLAVVDDQLRVRGLEGLRIVDASIMPTMPSANTGAASMMIGEKGADLILGRTPLAAESV